MKIFGRLSAREGAKKKKGVVSGLFEKCVREGTKMFQQVKKQNLRSWRSAVFLKNVSARDVTNLTHSGFAGGLFEKSPEHS